MEIAKRVDADFLPGGLPTEIHPTTNHDKEVSELESRVAETEGLIATFENQMVEWNTLNKLVRHDVELDKIQH